jgi:hypothetical protein
MLQHGSSENMTHDNQIIIPPFLMKLCSNTFFVIATAGSTAIRRSLREECSDVAISVPRFAYYFVTMFAMTIRHNLNMIAFFSQKIMIMSSGVCPKLIRTRYLSQPKTLSAAFPVKGYVTEAGLIVTMI